MGNNCISSPSDQIALSFIAQMWAVAMRMRMNWAVLEPFNCVPCYTDRTSSNAMSYNTVPGIWQISLETT